jgi:hypothetical protein
MMIASFISLVEVILRLQLAGLQFQGASPFMTQATNVAIILVRLICELCGLGFASQSWRNTVFEYSDVPGQPQTGSRLAALLVSLSVAKR